MDRHLANEDIQSIQKYAQCQTPLGNYKLKQDAATQCYASAAKESACNVGDTGDAGLIS